MIKFYLAAMRVSPLMGMNRKRRGVLLKALKNVRVSGFRSTLSSLEKREAVVDESKRT